MATAQPSGAQAGLLLLLLGFVSAAEGESAKARCSPPAKRTVLGPPAVLLISAPCSPLRRRGCRGRPPSLSPSWVEAGNKDCTLAGRGGRPASSCPPEGIILRGRRGHTQILVGITSLGETPFGAIPTLLFFLRTQFAALGVGDRQGAVCEERGGEGATGSPPPGGGGGGGRRMVCPSQALGWGRDTGGGGLQVRRQRLSNLNRAP